jgi:fibronectin type 3 domain-containing protein
VDVSGVSAWSTAFSFTTVQAIPGVPNNISPMDGATNIDWLGTTISWSQEVLATGYVLLLDDDINFGSPGTLNSTNNFNSTGMLLPNTTYYWQVQATNGSGSSSFSAVWSFTTGAIPAPVLNNPINNATGLAISGILLEWLPVQNATDYYVEYADNASFTGAIGNTVTTTSYLLPALNNNQTYYWHVYAGYIAYSSNYSTAFMFTTTGNNILAAPQLISPSNLSTAVPIAGTSLIWQNVSDALSYDWEISTDAAFTTVVNGNTTNTSTLLTGLTDNTTYYWHVRSVDADTISAWSSTFSFTTDLLSGIKNQYFETGVVYLNNEQLNIKLNQNLIGATCQIVNIAGQTIHQEVILDTNTQISTPQWSKGIYFVRLERNGKQQSFKIVVQ